MVDSRRAWLQLAPHEPMVPDLAGWRVERLPGLTIAPDWVCEVLSKSTEAIDRSEKLPIYAAQDVGHVWLVDPSDTTLEVYELGDSQAVGAKSESTRATPACASHPSSLSSALWNPPSAQSSPR